MQSSIIYVSFIALSLGFINLPNAEINSLSEKNEQLNYFDTIKNMTSIYSYSVKDIKGNDFSFETLKGKKILIVNTASECGYTFHYENLQKLYLQYKDSNFVVIGFPANNFGEQEPGSNEEIAHFCSSKFHVTFPMMQKISVKGDDQAPIYQWLTKKELNGVRDVEMVWNFQKILIDENGNFVKNIHHKTLPDEPSIIEWITKK